MLRVGDQAISRFQQCDFFITRTLGSAAGAWRWGALFRTRGGVRGNCRASVSAKRRA